MVRRGPAGVNTGQPVANRLAGRCVVTPSAVEAVPGGFDVLDEPQSPATLIGVAALDVPEHLVEIEVTAVL
jgi:hypothetical protein